MYYLLPFTITILLLGCSSKKQDSALAPPSQSNKTTFEKVIDGTIPAGEFSFEAKLATGEYGSQGLREAAKGMPSVPFQGIDTNTIKFFEIKKNIDLPDAADRDKLVLTGTQKDGKVFIVAIRRP